MEWKNILHVLVLSMVVLWFGDVWAVTYETAECRRVDYLDTNGDMTGTYSGYQNWTVNAGGGLILGTGLASTLGTWNYIRAVRSAYWDGSAWQMQAYGIQNVMILDIGPGTLYTSSLPTLASLGPCEVVCNENEDKIGNTCYPKCVAPQVRNPGTLVCEICPSQVWLNNICMPLCPRTSEQTGNTGDIGLYDGFACVIPPCGSGEKHELVEGTVNTWKCTPDCRPGYGYVSSDGSCSINCPFGMVQNEAGTGCENQCQGANAGMYWHPDETCKDYPPTPCPGGSTRNTEQGSPTYGKCVADPLDCADGFHEEMINGKAECVQTTLDCGPGKVQQGRECVSIPTKGDPSTPPDSPAEPTTGADVPAVVGENDTPEEKAAKYLDNIDDNTAKTVNNQGVINNKLQKISENQAKTVDNTAKVVEQLGETVNALKAVSEEIKAGTAEEKKGNENAASQTATLAGAIGGVTSAVNAAKTSITEKIDSMQTQSTGPDQPTLSGDLPEGTDYNENADNIGQSSAKAEERKTFIQSLTTNQPFGMTTSLDSNACLSGSIRNHPISICFDKPWMLSGFAIMRVILIAIGYVQVAVMLNRAIIA